MQLVVDRDKSSVRLYLWNPFSILFSPFIGRKCPDWKRDKKSIGKILTGLSNALLSVIYEKKLLLSGAYALIKQADNPAIGFSTGIELFNFFSDVILVTGYGRLVYIQYP